MMNCVFSFKIYHLCEIRNIKGCKQYDSEKYCNVRCVKRGEVYLKYNFCVLPKNTHQFKI